MFTLAAWRRGCSQNLPLGLHGFKTMRRGDAPGSPGRSVFQGVGRGPGERDWQRGAAHSYYVTLSFPFSRGYCMPSRLIIDGQKQAMHVLGQPGSSILDVPAA